MKKNYTSLGYSLDEIIDLYDSVGFQTRNMNYLLNWLHRHYLKTYLSSIDTGYIKQLAIDKAKLTCFNTMIDDISDNFKIRDKELLSIAIRIPWKGDVNYKNDYIKVMSNIWFDAIYSIERYPRFEEFEDIFYFDLDQFFSTIKYGFLANTLNIDNVLETTTFSYHNMMAILFCDMDLMCSPNFDKKELSKLRPILHWVQDICHIGNIISTYHREVFEADFSSPIISMAINDDIVSREDIIKNPKKALEEIKFIEPYYKTRAEEDFQKIIDKIHTIKTVDIADFSNKIRNVYEAFLERPPYWNGEAIQKMEVSPIIKTVNRKDSLKWVRM